MNCYCRSQGICDDCGGHECTGQCTCNHDGAPQTQEVGVGTYRTTDHLSIWELDKEMKL